MRILTWHVHGSYLFYLVHGRHEYYLPVKPGRPEGYGGRLPGFPWPHNVHEIPAARVRDHAFDCILYQSSKNYLKDQHEILSDRQRQLPKVFLEHDPPRESPTDTRHIVDDPDLLLVHVTHFNNLAWDPGRTPTRVIEHGVMVPADLPYTGRIVRGLVVVNNLRSRGRRLGADIFEKVSRQIPLDLVGMDSEALGGLGSLTRDELMQRLVHYRFLFNPIRYTSLGLAVCEAMMLGVPVIGLATTEMATVVENGVSGYVDTDVDRLVHRMRELLQDPAAAQKLSEGARSQARRRFSIERFLRDWDAVFESVAGRVPVGSRGAYA